MDTFYIGIMTAVGGASLLAIVWKLGRWQAQREDRDEAQDAAIADLREEVEGKEND